MFVEDLCIVEYEVAHCAVDRSNRCPASDLPFLRDIPPNTSSMTPNEMFFKHINPAKLLQPCRAKLRAELANQSSFEMLECVPSLVKFSIKCFGAGVEGALLLPLALRRRWPRIWVFRGFTVKQPRLRN
jgi:hypothetical protein